MRIKMINFYENKVMLILLLCIGFSLVGCSQPSLDKKRRATMLKVINAIKVNDTIATGRLIDTAYCFKINSKENYYNSINKLFKKFLKNQILTTVDENNFVLSEERSFGKTYKLILYTAADKKKYYEILMEFIGGTFNKVYYFNSYFHNETPVILVPAPN
jgi:hypothetical protein